MTGVRGLTVSVGYADVLRITLVRNMRHFAECWVLTSPEDEATQEVARSVPGVRLSITDDFTKHNALFNKGLAIERAGFDAMGRDGWILLHDADVLLPDFLHLDRLRPDCLHGARRRVLEDPSAWHPGLDWSLFPRLRDGNAPIGFFQLWHGGAPAVRDVRPWYDVSFPHAGGSDSAFAALWPRGKRAVLPVDVLHLGPVDTNWFGCDGPSKDLMAKYVYRNEWPRAMRNFTAEDAARAGALPGRVRVPGYAPSSFELPFERRARGGK